MSKGHEFSWACLFPWNEAHIIACGEDLEEGKSAYL